MKLSVIIPCYNERPYIERVLQRVVMALPQVEKEVIVVDDGSTDGTREWLMETFGVTNPHPIFITWAEETGWQVQSLPLRKGQEKQGDGASAPRPCTLRVIFHERNRGKGAALRTGFAAATGDVLVIQDADLEYDPRDWEEMWHMPMSSMAHAFTVSPTERFTIITFSATKSFPTSSTCSAM